MSNTFGQTFRVTTFGESHGPAMGAVIDGCPAGLPLSPEDIRRELARDVPEPEIGTTRREPNEPEVLSGVYEGRTLGTPILILIRNVDVNSGDYLDRKNRPRPGHADLTWRLKYGHVDPRGGGRASGRECIARLAAGAVAKKLLALRDITVRSSVTELAGLPAGRPAELALAREEVKRIAGEGDSTGGTVTVTAEGVPAGLGRPVFGKLGARLGQALLSIGGVKALEFGAGRAHARMRGTESNDPIIREGREVRPSTNRAGGMLGGISTGLPLVVRLSVKPTPSIRAEQETVDFESGESARVSTTGRFDLNIAPRVAVVAEAMTAIVLADALLEDGFLPPVRVEGEGA